MKKLLIYKAKGNSLGKDRLQFLTENSGVILFSVLYFSGITLGAFFYFGRFGDFLHEYTGNLLEMPTGQLALTFFLEGILTILIGIFSAFSGFGTATVFLLPVFRGALSSMLLLHLLQENQYKGLLMFSLIVLPGATLQAVVNILYTSFCAGLSKAVLRSICLKGEEKIEFKALIPMAGIVFAGTAVSFVLTVLLDKLFYSLF